MTVIEQEPLAAPFAVEVDEVRQMFWSAADLIEEKGWVQGTAKSEDGFCIMGALHEIAAFNGRGWSQVVEVVSTAFADIYPNDPVTWNDYAARSKEEVVAKLRELADSR